MLTNVEVSEAIAKENALLAEQTGVPAEKVVAELALIGFANMQDSMDLSDPENPTIDLSNLTPEQASVIKEATVEKKRGEWR